MRSSRKVIQPRYKKVRYSNETTCINTLSTVSANTTPTLPTYTDQSGGTHNGQILVQEALAQGTRKAKNFQMSISSAGNSVPLLCAIVYVPQGTEPSSITAPNNTIRTGSSLYEPNQNVIMQFVLNPVNTTSGAGSDVQTFKTRLARNLDSGDTIVFIYCPAYGSSETQTIQIAGTFNYAISY